VLSNDPRENYFRNRKHEAKAGIGKAENRKPILTSFPLSEFQFSALVYLYFKTSAKPGFKWWRRSVTAVGSDMFTSHRRSPSAATVVLQKSHFLNFPFEPWPAIFPGHEF
jgi:hypothetical protein